MIDAHDNIDEKLSIIMFVLDNPNQLDEVLDAWRHIGVDGATIIESIDWKNRPLLIYSALITVSGIVSRRETFRSAKDAVPEHNLTLMYLPGG